MRILQLAPIWETVPPPAYGGTETIVDILTEELVRRRHDVTLWASGDSQTSARLRSVVPRSLRAAGLTQEALQYAAVHVASALGEAGDYDIIHSHNGPPSELAMAMSLAHPEIPMLTTLHCQPTPETAFISSHYRGWYNVISQQQARVISPFPEGHYAGVVYNATRVESFPYQTDKDDYVLYMGRMTPEKPPHLAAEAARMAGIQLLIAGKMSTEEEHRYYETCLKPILNRPGVQFLGEADGEMKRKLYAGAKCLLLPLCWEEPFGLVMIEAMACGTPVIAFNRGAASEIIIDGENGFLVTNVEEMASAIKNVQDIDPLRCRRSVEERFSPGALADRYLEVYEDVIAHSGRRTHEKTNILPQLLTGI